MNIKALKEAAKTLRDKLEFYKQRDSDASILLLSLESLLCRAEQGEITEMVEPRDIPGYKLLPKRTCKLMGIWKRPTLIFVLNSQRCAKQMRIRCWRPRWLSVESLFNRG